MRRFILMLPFVLSACATGSGEQGGMLIETVSHGRPLPGAACVVNTDRGTNSVTTPATVSVADARGELRIVCDKQGYRTSEFVFRPASRSGSNMGIGLGGGGGHFGLGVGLNFPISIGAGSYPSHVTVDMNPL